MSDIVPFLLCLQPALPATTFRQLCRIVGALLCMPGRISQLGISRWAGAGGSYRTVHRFFHTPIDWLQVKWLLFEAFHYDAEDTYLLVGDEHVEGKAGKRTFGLDRVFSSLAGKPIAGLSFFCFSLVSVKRRRAYPLLEEQVVRTEEEKEASKQRQQQRKARRSCKHPQPKRPRGRPKGSKNRNKADVVLSAELERILGWAQKVLARLGSSVRVQYLVLDGHFGNNASYQMTRRLGLHLISKLHSNAGLCLEPRAEEKQEHPRRKYGAKVDYVHLPAEALVCSWEEEGLLCEVFQMRCWNKEFADLLNVVILRKTDESRGRVAHVVLFSSDLALDALTLIDYYSLRYQIEFEFRDARQYWGLDDFMGITKTSVANAVGLSFFMVSLSLALLERLRQDFPQAGVLDLKSLHRGFRYVEETLKCLSFSPDRFVCRRVMEQVARLGFIHGAANTVSTAPQDAPIPPKKARDALPNAA